MIVLNFKTYYQATSGNKAVELAKIAEEVSLAHNVPIIVCVQATDVYKVAQEVKIPVYAQHIDAVDQGKTTGYVTALAVKENGATGVLLNHSEHGISIRQIEQTVEMAQQYELKTLVCIDRIGDAEAIDMLNPDMIAFEDRELIGGGLSITQSPKDCEKIERFVNLNLGAQLLIGAGVKDKHDLKMALEMKVSGVLLASGFVLADNPREFLESLVIECKGICLK